MPKRPLLEWNYKPACWRLRRSWLSPVVLSAFIAAVVAASLVQQMPAAANTELTATFSNVPSTHDGSEFTFNLTFDPEPDLSYVTLKEHAFTVVSGTISRARRVTKGSNAEWTIKVLPGLDSNENPVEEVSITLPSTTSCSDLGAICTSDDLMLSNETAITVPLTSDLPERPGQPQAVTATQGSKIGEIALSWTASQVGTDPDEAVRGYRVRYDCGGDTVTTRHGSDTRSVVIESIARSQSCRINVAARNDGGYGGVAWAGSDSTYHKPLNPPEVPASITVADDPDSDGTKVTWTAPVSGDAPTSYQIAYWDINAGIFQYITHSSTTDLEVVINKAPAHLRTVAVRGRLDDVPRRVVEQEFKLGWTPAGRNARGVWGAWAVGWHSSAIPSDLDSMTQSSSLSLSLSHSDDDGTAGKLIDLSDIQGAMCPTIAGVYVDTDNDRAWIADPCSGWVHAYDIGSDGTLTHNLDKSLTRDELYPSSGVGRTNPVYTPTALWSDGEILWVSERDLGMLLPYRLSDGSLIYDRRVMMVPFNAYGHSFLAPIAVWSDGETAWVVDHMVTSLIFGVTLDNEIAQPIDRAEQRFVPSGFDACFIPEDPRVSDLMSQAPECLSETALRSAIDSSLDEPVGAYSDGRWLWIAVNYSDRGVKGKLLAFNLLSGERAASRDITLHRNITDPSGMWSDGDSLWVTDKGKERLYTFSIPQQERAAQQSPPVAEVTVMEGFTLVDTDDRANPVELTDDGTVTLDDPANGSFGIRVDVVTGASIGSIKLTLSGDETAVRTDNEAPYSLHGDNGIDIRGDSLAAGSYTLQATAYSGYDLAGDVLQTLEVSFTVADSGVRDLGLDDFDAGADQDVLASALIQTGNRGRKNNENEDRAWYATNTTARHASGQLRDGSLAWNGMTMTRVVYFPNSGVFRFNQGGSSHIGDSFAEGGANREATIWIQTENETVSFLAKDNIRNSGGGYINFEVPTSIQSVLGGVSEGDRIIIAVTVPETS